MPYSGDSGILESFPWIEFSLGATCLRLCRSENTCLPGRPAQNKKILQILKFKYQVFFKNKSIKNQRSGYTQKDSAFTKSTGKVICIFSICFYSKDFYNYFRSFTVLNFRHLFSSEYWFSFMHIKLTVLHMILQF